MNRMTMIYIIGSIIGVIVLIYVIGLLLPKERVVTRQAVFPVSSEILYSIVTNNEDWQYSTDLDNLIIIETDEEHEVWDEITNNGTIIRFTTKEKIPYSYYSFNMESKMFSGHWTASFEDLDNKRTLFKATEYISIKNPFVKVFSYLFFDIGKLMENYQNDLKKEVYSRQVSN